MSQPVAVSNARQVSKAQVTNNRQSQPPRHVPRHRGRCGAFRSQIRSQHCTQQMQQPRRLTAVDSAASSPGDTRATGSITPLRVSDDSAATTVNRASMVLRWASLLECRRWARHDAVHGQRGTSASLWMEPVAPNPPLRSRTPPNRPRRPTDKSVRSTTPADRGRRCAESYGRISQ